MNEIDQFEGTPTGAVSAFSIDPTGKLTLLNRSGSLGAGPCHLILDNAGRYLLVANCGSGSVTVLPVGRDGRLGEATNVVQYKGAQLKCVALDPANRFAFACDAGSDKVVTYRFDAQQGELSPGDPGFTSVKAGAGPRRIVSRPGVLPTSSTGGTLLSPFSPTTRRRES